MKNTVAEESLANLSSYWNDSVRHPNRAALFVSPAWLDSWWQIFGSESELFLRTVWQGDSLIGIAPLLSRDGTAYFIGSDNVCDYLDFIANPGKEDEFFHALFDNLRERGIHRLELGPLRPDSLALTELVPIAQQRNCQVNYHQEEVTVELDLPANWDDCLAMLTKKQRHEVRRKLRRLWEAENIDYHCLEASPGKLEGFMDTFSRNVVGSVNPVLQTIMRHLTRRDFFTRKIARIFDRAPVFLAREDVQQVLPQIIRDAI